MHPFLLLGAGTLMGVVISTLFNEEPASSGVMLSEARLNFPVFLEEAVASAKAAKQEEMGYDGPPPGQLAKGVLAKVPGITESVAMYYAMLDPDTPMRAKMTIAGALLYLVSPWDVIPDTIPGLGQLDDAGVVFASFAQVYSHVKPEHKEKAQAWLVYHGVEPKPIFEIGQAVELIYPQEQGKPDASVQGDFVFGYTPDDEYGAHAGVRSMERMQRDRGDAYGYAPDDEYGLSRVDLFGDNDDDEFDDEDDFGAFWQSKEKRLQIVEKKMAKRAAKLQRKGKDPGGDKRYQNLLRRMQRLQQKLGVPITEGGPNDPHAGPAGDYVEPDYIAQAKALLGDTSGPSGEDDEPGFTSSDNAGFRFMS